MAFSGWTHGDDGSVASTKHMPRVRLAARCSPLLSCYNPHRHPPGWALSL